MQKILVAGATGRLGRLVAAELKQKDFFVRALARSQEKAEIVKASADEIIIADPLKPETLSGVCDNIDILFSAMGKSVMIGDKNKQSFRESDVVANRNLLEVAKQAGVKRVVYVSVFNGEANRDITYCGVHEEIVDEIKLSGLDHTIIRPTAFFSALGEILDMAKKGQAMSLGLGSKKTNPIDDRDLAEVCVDNMVEGEETVNVGGPAIYSRMEILELAYKALGREKKVRQVPMWVADVALPVLRIVNRNTADKVEFFKRILTQDLIAPQYGQRRLEDFYHQRARELK